MVYKWTAGARIKADAQAAGEVCAELESQGALTPENLVEVSTPEDAPLHGEFEWNDELAATLYRETQARHIIRSLVVQRSATKPSTRAFVTLQRTASEHAYHDINAVLNREDDRDSLLIQCRRDLEAFRHKYIAILDAAGIMWQVDGLIAALSDKQSVA